MGMVVYPNLKIFFRLRNFLHSSKNHNIMKIFLRAVITSISLGISWLLRSITKLFNKTVINSLVILVVAFGVAYMNNRYSQQQDQIKCNNEFVKNIKLFTYYNIDLYKERNDVQIFYIQQKEAFDTNLDYALRPNQIEQFKASMIWQREQANSLGLRSEGRISELNSKLESLASEMAMQESRIREYYRPRAGMEKSIDSLMSYFYKSMNRESNSLVFDYQRLILKKHPDINHDKYDSTLAAVSREMEKIGNKITSRMSVHLPQNPNPF